MPARLQSAMLRWPRLLELWRMHVMARELDRVPARVRAEIDGHHLVGERLIAWAELAGGGFFLVIWVLTMGAFRPDGYVDPAPVILCLYMAFAAARLWLGRSGKLAGLPVSAFVLLDVSVLMALIVCLPITHGAPLAVALKHSAFSFLFLVIAVQALRFEPAYVIIAGTAAAALWTGLALAAALLGPPGTVTSSIDAYLAGPGVLPAAEFDRVAALLAFTGVLSLIVARGNTLLVRAVSTQAANTELARYFPPTLAEQITRAEREFVPGVAQTRAATMVFFDLRGFSAFAQHAEGREVLGLLAAYHALVVPIIRSHGGSVDKFLGDGILASFGAVHPSATHARDALEALIAAVDAGEASAEQSASAGLPSLTVNGAAASGEILFGAIGHKDRLEFTVIGDAVNVAAKLEKHTKAEHVPAIATATTYQLARAQGFVRALETRPDRQVEGLGSPIDLVVYSRAEGKAS